MVFPSQPPRARKSRAIRLFRPPVFPFRLSTANRRSRHVWTIRPSLLSYHLCFHILAHSFALTKIATLSFSIVPALFAKNRPGGGGLSAIPFPSRLQIGHYNHGRLGSEHMVATSMSGAQTGAIEPEMVRIPEGWFGMGCATGRDDEKP